MWLLFPRHALLTDGVKHRSDAPVERSWRFSVWCWGVCSIYLSLPRDHQFFLVWPFSPSVTIFSSRLTIFSPRRAQLTDGAKHDRMHPLKGLGNVVSGGDVYVVSMYRCFVTTNFYSVTIFCLECDHFSSSVTFFFLGVHSWPMVSNTVRCTRWKVLAI